MRPIAHAGGVGRRGVLAMRGAAAVTRALTTGARQPTLRQPRSQYVGDLWEHWPGGDTDLVTSSLDNHVLIDMTRVGFLPSEVLSRPHWWSLLYDDAGTAQVSLTTHACFGAHVSVVFVVLTECALA